MFVGRWRLVGMGFCSSVFEFMVWWRRGVGGFLCVLSVVEMCSVFITGRFCRGFGGGRKLVS